MRKQRIMAWAAALVLLLSFSAVRAEGNWYGSVVCEEPVVVRAPYGGRVEEISVRPGAWIPEGGKICALGTTGVYAPADGTVTAVFVRPGDSVETVRGLYGGTVYLTPPERFLVRATLAGAAKKDAACHVSVGQTVYLELSPRRTETAGKGTVTEVIPASAEAETPMGYLVRITEGAFFPDDKVAVYRDVSRDKKTALGTGTVEQAPALVIAGDAGSVLRVHVSPGDTVKRGDLLFETVAGELAGLAPVSGEVKAPCAGIVAASEMTDGAPAEQGAALITLWPRDRLQACVTVSETELKAFPAGQAVDLYFSGEETPVKGTVASVSYAAEAAEGTARAGYAAYKVYIDFDADESIRQGMFVTVALPEAEEE